MQCKKCKYVLGPFDDVCPRCGSNTSKQIADASFHEDDIAVTKNTPTTYPFPTDGHAMITQSGKQYGPYTLAEINSHLKSGNLAPSDILMTDSREWVILKRVQGVILPPSAAVPPKSAPLEYPFPASYEGNIPYNEILSKDTDNIKSKSLDKGLIALSVLAFLFPIVGGVIWMVLTNNKSPKAEKIGQWTYYGIIFNLTFFASLRLF